MPSLRRYRGMLILLLCAAAAGNAAGSAASCGMGYVLLQGDISGWGTIAGHGGGEDVVSCDECGNICNGMLLCLSFECSQTALKCNLNTANLPRDPSYLDYMFCAKASHELSRRLRSEKNLLTTNQKQYQFNHLNPNL